MWIKCPNGLDTLVHHEDHIKRLLSEGGVEIADPTSTPFELIPTVFEPAVEAPIETVFDLPVTTELAVDTVASGDEPTTRKRGRQARQQ